MPGTTCIRRVLTQDIPALTVATGDINDLAVTAGKIGDAAVTQSRIYTKAIIAIGAGPYTPTAAQILGSGIFSLTPGGVTTFTLPTAALLVAGLANVQVGTFFEFTVISNDANNITVTAAAGITLTGIAATFIVNNVTESYLGYFTNVTPAAEAVTVVRQ